MKHIFSGSIVAIVTPMQANGEVDCLALRRLVDWHIESETSAIVAVGTTGESPVLDSAEYMEVIRAVVEQSASRIPVIAGTGASSTRQSVKLTQLAKLAGASACLCVTPYYNKPTQKGLLEHYTEVANAEDIPLILYNVPSRTAVDLLPETVLQLAELDNVVALKEAVNTTSRQMELIDLVADKLSLLSGDDASCLDFMLAGAKGVISVTANIAPLEMAQMCRYALAGQREKALKKDLNLQYLHRDLFLESNPIPVKWALSRMGKIPAGIRLPLTGFSQSHQLTLEKSMIRAGIRFNECGEK